MQRDDADDPFSDFSEPIEEGGTAKPATLGFVTLAPAANSTELCLRERMMLDPILHREILFVEDGELDAQPTPLDPEIAAVRSAVAADYCRHISLSRSTGPAGTRLEYEQECRRNGMRPIFTEGEKS